MRNWALVGKVGMLLLLASRPAARQGQLTAQVIIRDTISINSGLETTFSLQTEQSLTEQPLFVFGGGLTVSTTQPGVVVSGSISVSGDNLPRLSTILLHVRIGEQNYERKLERNCAGQDVSNVSPIPSTLIAGCGSIGLSVHVWYPYGWYCAVSYTRADSLRVLVSGSTATYEIVQRFYDWDIRKWVTVRVTVQLSGSLGEGAGVQNVVVESDMDKLDGEGLASIEVSAYGATGALYVPCGGQPLVATASVQAQGEYVYLDAGGQTGTSVSVPLSGGKGSFKMVFDPSKGVVPEGRDVVRIQVSVLGASGEAEVEVRTEVIDIDVNIERATLMPTLTSTPQANEGNNNETAVSVRATRNDRPAADEVLEVRTRAIIPSGGHEGHPTFPDEQLGVFFWNGQQGNPLTVKTNQQGEVEGLKYKTGEFSVLMEFIVKQ